MVLPRWCVLCGVAATDAPCASCRDVVARQRRPRLDVTPPPGVDRCLAPFRYDGALRPLLAALKYRNRREALAWLADEVAPAVRLLAEPWPEPDPRPGSPANGAGAAAVVVTWAPTSSARRRRRGFDHAELLARAVGGRAGLSVRPLLRRRPGPPQTGRGAAERRAGPSFVVSRSPRAARVVLVDDVGTTGATLAASASALAAVGVSVDAVVVAWTPPVPGGE